MGGIAPAVVLLETKNVKFFHHSHKEKSYSAGGESGFSSSSKILFIACVDAVGVAGFIGRCCTAGRSTSSSTEPKNNHTLNIHSKSKLQENFKH